MNRNHSLSTGWLLATFAFLIIGIAPANAQNTKTIRAVTETGKAVLLNGDGTWALALVEKPKNGELTFRQTKWGMSASEVVATEANEPELIQDDIIMYNGTVASISCYVAYIFVEDQLVRAKYIFNESHSNKNSYLSDYSSISEILSGKYGTPESDNTVWLNDLYQDDPQEYGMAIAVGHLSKYGQWETGVSTISHLISGDNYDITHVVEYQSKALGKLEDIQKEKQNTADF